MIKFSRWRKLFERYVTKIVVLTNFAKNKMVEAGLPESKMVIKSNFAFTKRKELPTSGSYVCFLLVGYQRRKVNWVASRGFSWNSR